MSAELDEYSVREGRKREVRNRESPMRRLYCDPRKGRRETEHD